MTHTERKIERIAQIMSYIQLGLDGDKGKNDKAEWLYHLINHHIDDVDREIRQEAIERRTRLNCGYSKAGH